MRLSDVVQILSGLPFRIRIESEADGAYVVVQPRDLSGDGRIRLKSSARLRTLPGSPRGFLQAGDIVFQPRGIRYSVAKIERIDTPMVAAAPLLILRPDAAHIAPDFLAALLQSPATQATLRQAAVGTYVPQVPRQAIEALPIELPDLSSQMRLADLAHLERQEAALMERLSNARGRLFDLAVAEIAERSRRRSNASSSRQTLLDVPGPALSKSAGPIQR